jgi:hypothetical protein
VEFHAASVAQLKLLIEFVAARDSNLDVDTLRLKSPHDATGGGADERWGVEMVLTQRIYAPKSSGP